MGSVKDLTILRKPIEEKLGIGYFQFSDRYSVFDWGKMPDEIPNKGASLTIMTAHFFELLKKKGIHSHYLGILSNGETISLNETNKPFNKIKVKILRVVEPKRNEERYNYSVYEELNKNFLIPLEFIYRNSIPEGSSFWKRYRSGKIKYGTLKTLKPNTLLKEPILDVSTKLEESDRYLSFDEAKNLVHLSSGRINEIKRKLFTVNTLITEEAKRSGITNQDGKLEFGIDDEGSLMVVDALGTLDECRFLFEGFSISKETLRKYYRKTEWFQEVKRAKEKNKRNWKSLVKTSPPPLPKDLKDTVSSIYQSVANLISNKKFFNVPPLKELVKNLSKLI
ncbi:MAG: phosphoribosylaminoimidazolesuccinocarboxamide synthase [candidate division WOR-3 bacterium]|nr:phosphoribosylaminoimidazolesuccinocarboxamide synthase [candidate division WOR-3 bacterium]